MKYSEAAKRISRAYGWSYAFSLEYAMALKYHLLSHSGAYKYAMQSHYVKLKEKPESLSAPKERIW